MTMVNVAKLGGATPFGYCRVVLLVSLYTYQSEKFFRRPVLLNVVVENHIRLLDVIVLLFQLLVERDAELARSYSNDSLQ